MNRTGWSGRSFLRPDATTRAPRAAGRPFAHRSPDGPRPETDLADWALGNGGLELAHALARALAALVRGKLFTSESDYPYKPFAATLPAGVVLDAETFRGTAGIGPRYDITVASADQFFEDHIHPVDGDDDDVPAYVLLQKAMGATLSNLSLISVGGENVVRVRVYLVGRLDGGDLSGLSTISIET